MWFFTMVAQKSKNFLCHAKVDGWLQFFYNAADGASKNFLRLASSINRLVLIAYRPVARISTRLIDVTMWVHNVSMIDWHRML